MGVTSLLLVPLLCAAAVVARTHTCSLPPATEEELHVTTERKTWYVQFQYEAPDIGRLGCYVLTQSPGDDHYDLFLNGSFSRQPDFPVAAKIIFKGNRMIKEYEDHWDNEFSGEYNVAYADKEIFIDHFCYLGHEMAQIFTTEKKPSAELLDRIWKIVEQHHEVQRSKFKEVVC